MDLLPVALTWRRHPGDPEAGPRFWVFASAAGLAAAFGSGQPEIDFERYLVLVAHRGFCPSSGYDIGLEAAEQEGDTVTVRVRLTDPPAGAITLTVITYPRTASLLDKAALQPAGPLTFRFVDRAGRLLGVCEAGAD